MKKHKWSANNIAFGSGGVLPELSSLLQMLMISLLHAKPNFAQFSAAYLRHTPWAPDSFSLVRLDVSVSRESAHEKSLVLRVYHAQKENNYCLCLKQLARVLVLKGFTKVSSLQRFMAAVSLRKGVYSGHSLSTVVIFSPHFDTVCPVLHGSVYMRRPLRYHKVINWCGIILVLQGRCFKNWIAIRRSVLTSVVLLL